MTADEKSKCPMCGTEFELRGRVYCSACDPLTTFGLSGGVTLRDVFAAFAVQGILALGLTDPSQQARDAYAVADAMLRARRSE